MIKDIKDQLLESAAIKKQLADNYTEIIADAARRCIEALNNGGKIMFCGNGGSAADSQHLATELVVRLAREIEKRPALPSIALTTDTSILTACANDIGFNLIFARQIEALGRSADILIAISTSGKSPNILEAVKAARDKQIYTIGLTGKNGGNLADTTIAVPSEDAQRIQESHIAIGHIIIGLIEREIIKHGYTGEAQRS
ncbi:MAG: SIS domain-containing protein [candidate division Zixibacteria bacterium]|nr:SIS domain-containing protein [candidate division Zixibacteria bacterium]